MALALLAEGFSHFGLHFLNICFGLIRFKLLVSQFTLVLDHLCKRAESLVLVGVVRLLSGNLLYSVLVGYGGRDPGVSHSHIFHYLLDVF